MVTSYGIFHFHNIYYSFKLFYFPWEVPWGPFGSPLGSLGEVWEGPLWSFGGSQGQLTVDRQPTGNPSLYMLILGKEY